MATQGILLKFILTYDDQEVVTCLYASNVSEEEDIERANTFIERWKKDSGSFLEKLDCDDLEVEVILVPKQAHDCLEQLFGDEFYFPNFPIEEYLEYTSGIDDDSDDSSDDAELSTYVSSYDEDYGEESDDY